jgi:AmmeMemoRadiSam system protein B
MSATPLKATIRPPLVDGLFYPARRDALAAQVDDLLSRSPVARAARFAVISPHAGYEHAGAVMAAAFRGIAERRIGRAVLIGPVHRDPVEGIYLPESEAFSTPLGHTPVDTKAVDALLSCGPLFRRDDIPHLEEHCLELQIPFLVRLFPGISIVPMLVGSGRYAVASALQRALQLTFADTAAYTVFIVTANMSSYMTGKDPDAESAAMEQLLLRGDAKGIVAAAERRVISACAPAAIAAVLSLAGSDCRVEMLARARSQAEDADPSHVVHYAALSIDPAPPA